MKEDILVMNRKERQRKAIVEAIKSRHFTLVEAAERLHLSSRQMRRILRRYEQEGDKGLIHRHRGKASNRQSDLNNKEQILELYRKKYIGFGPTLAAEKISQENKKEVIAETLRLWL